MTFRYYTDQLARMEPSKRQELERRATARTQKWIDVPSLCEGLPQSHSEIQRLPEVRPSGPLRRADRSAGLGDSIKKLADATGVSQLARAYERVTGRSCGCEERRQKLNQRFPYEAH